jgi:ATP-dependent helicase HepA
VAAYICGQRWINDARLEMGPGSVVAADKRTVTLHFHSVDESFTYAAENAPLTRLRFSRGDQIRDGEERELHVEAVRERDGLLYYQARDRQGDSVELCESALGYRMQLNRPAERLLFGQIDDSRWFDLRRRTLQQLGDLARSDLRGLGSCRTSLIPHQLYIAHEVARRYAPRVLLADEVGLGKTIEAGLILHQQLVTERARRVLIIVPESLQLQWLVEMLRRFNLAFSIFDEERCRALEESTLDDAALSNPFHTEQLVLCSLEFLCGSPGRGAQCLDGEWHLLVVDEAHHLQWTPQKASAEYRFVEQLAASTRGVLLLTATPEQLGKAGHFARLRLLDPDRYDTFDAYLAEEEDYARIAAAVAQLLEADRLDDETLRLLQETVREGDNLHYLRALRSTQGDTAANEAARNALAEHLLDRHGTGRVLFRNSRAAVKGFPLRQLAAVELPLPPAYAEAIASSVAAAVATASLLAPERLYQAQAGEGMPPWTAFDPRIDWTLALLRRLAPEKVLLITAFSATAVELAQTLRERAGLRAAVFHEGLTLVERDRAAAFFAAREDGAQLLICSEIGSEGRNFQFASHLLLFDLPLHPDLLEQRIGRLDRIGQGSSFRMHVPLLQGSPQQRLFRWFDEAVNLFAGYSAAAQATYAKVERELADALTHGDAQLQALIERSRRMHRCLEEQLQRGRDRLLEYNSCRPRIAAALKQRLLLQQQSPDLADYMDATCDALGIESEETGPYTTLLRYRHGASSGGVPGLPEDGMSITYDREWALANEDIHFMSWDHPLVGSVMELISSSEFGNCAFTAVKYGGARRGELLMESIHLVDAGAGDGSAGNIHVPTTTIRVLLDEQGRSHAESLGAAHIESRQLAVSRETARRVVRAKEQRLREMMQANQQLARQLAPEIIATAQQEAHRSLNKEIHRLKALSQLNPSVRPEEIRHFEAQLEAVDSALESATLRLDAVRVIVAV